MDRAEFQARLELLAETPEHIALMFFLSTILLRRHVSDKNMHAIFEEAMALMSIPQNQLGN